MLLIKNHIAHLSTCAETSSSNSRYWVLLELISTSLLQPLARLFLLPGLHFTPPPLFPGEGNCWFGKRDPGTQAPNIKNLLYQKFAPTMWRRQWSKNPNFQSPGQKTKAVSVISCLQFFVHQSTRMPGIGMPAIQVFA